MKTSAVLAMILEEETPVKTACVPEIPGNIPFNEQRKAVRELLETAWLRPYHAVYCEIENAVTYREPEPIDYNGWIKSLSGKSDLVQWSRHIWDTLEMDQETTFFTMWKFKWGNATFKINNDLESVYTVWKRLNMRLS